MELSEFFARNPKTALAFSGGVDSSFLLYAGMRYGKEIKAYYVRTAFQPEFEYQDALRLAASLGAQLKVITPDVLSQPQVTANPANRCYYCKQVIFSSILEHARNDGFSVLLDGTNASDAEGDRPGMRALRELSVRSPLRECGLTKARIRELSREAGLFTWDKPAYACLATRIPTGTEITKENLARTEWAEGWMSGLGFRDFRIRTTADGQAKLQLREADFPRLLENRTEIAAELKQHYTGVLLDLEERK
ncbi:MAG: ATP-dependent sacrificial sulfur transferase LarE [Clostridiales bacterium]|nr:ATP-dependent sacrificial sulfur transferase LarE [Clostridiales bacterium]